MGVGIVVIEISLNEASFAFLIFLIGFIIGAIVGSTIRG